MQSFKKVTTTLLGVLLIASFILLSYMEESLFLDRILLCSFILGAVLLANIRSGVRRVIPEEEKKNR
ncbi:hypothetical protein [[Muricauda] lutisoli]|uniref:Uncharacterized protein n=1 Tax=[Muricauda] lutisoli TaxID=2816035 RepID=A0ABS3ESG7_9FLAO|nr:hypothetical protein [[Muricauda] lutisoli]MBO0329095.1 hypothetical protein [[Muricauda] lutisoli]